jgi:hypothetical protein
VFSIFFFFSWFLAVLVTGMIGVLLVFIIVMVEFIAYFTDKDKGDILLPYIGMLMYQRWLSCFRPFCFLAPKDF